MNHFASPQPHGNPQSMIQGQSVSGNAAQLTSTRVRLESLNNSVDYAPQSGKTHTRNNSNPTQNQVLSNVITKTNSRGYNRSQVPQQQVGQNNIGIIQNFNSYHIELKNMGGASNT